MINLFYSDLHLPPCCRVASPILWHVVSLIRKSKIEITCKIRRKYVKSEHDLYLLEQKLNIRIKENAYIKPPLFVYSRYCYFSILTASIVILRQVYVSISLYSAFYRTIFFLYFSWFIETSDWLSIHVGDWTVVIDKGDVYQLFPAEFLVCPVRLSLVQAKMIVILFPKMFLLFVLWCE